MRAAGMTSLPCHKSLQALAKIVGSYFLRRTGSGARETALFFGRHYGRLNLKELGQLAGGIHHNAVSIAIRRFTERLKSDSTLLAKFSLVEKALALLARVGPYTRTCGRCNVSRSGFARFWYKHSRSCCPMIAYQER